MPRTATKKSSSSSSKSKSSSNSRSQSSGGSSSKTNSRGATSRGGSSGGGRGSSSPTSRNKGAGMSRSMEKSLIHEYFHEELKDILWAEKALVKALQKMSKSATTQELKNAFLEHRDVTQNQVERLNQCFELLGKRPQAKTCEAMKGIIEEANSVIEDTEDDTYTRDVALIVGAQKAEHYEIATYGSLVTLATAMGHTEIAELLQATLDEEKQTDSLLTQIAEGHINEEALAEGDGEEDEEEEEA
jgi:ferritin-like metal-binding protein YciE